MEAFVVIFDGSTEAFGHLARTVARNEIRVDRLVLDHHAEAVPLLTLKVLRALRQTRLLVVERELDVEVL